MGMELTNARLAGNTTHIQKITPARTSIAEDAIFIPKPYDRADFNIVATGQLPEANLPGSGNASGSPVSGDGLKSGSLGKDGISATLTKADYSARANHVEIEYDYTPEKNFDAIAPQEEGRQTNNAHTTHYSQQYDAYGRPRIGFSREPYDFAATKFISKTSEIRLMENVETSRAAYAYADMRNQSNATTENMEASLSPMSKKMPESQAVGNSDASTPQTTVQPGNGNGSADNQPIPLPGSNDPSLKEEMRPINYDKVPGAIKPGDIKEEKSPDKPTPEPAVMRPEHNIAETAGLNFKEVLTTNGNGSDSKANEVVPEKTSKHLSITA